MKEKRLLGSYETFDGKKLTYYSEYDYEDGWYTTQQTEGEKKTVDVDESDVINLLLLHINYLEETAWEEAGGDE